MGLDFYVAQSFDEIQANDETVELKEELQEYLYKRREAINFDIECIYGIDPYGDTEIEREQMKNIIIACEKITDGEYLSDYDDIEDGRESLNELKNLCKRAIENNKRLCAIGD